MVEGFWNGGEGDRRISIGIRRLPYAALDFSARTRKCAWQGLMSLPRC